MKGRSLRFELTFSYSVVMGVTLLVVGVAIERVAYNRISASIDNSLRQSAYAVINEVALLEGNVSTIPSDPAYTVLNPPPWPPRYVQLLSMDGRIVYRSRNLGHHALPYDLEKIRSQRSRLYMWPDMRLDNDEPVRLITFKLPAIKGEQMGWGLAALSLHDLDRARKKNQLALFFTLPAAIIISAIAGRWLARRALRPINDVITTAQRIRAENLHERLKAREVDDELGKLIETLNDLFGRLEDNFRQISRFSADVSHELRTPLTIIQGEAEVALRRGATHEEMQLALELVLDEARRMSTLVRNLLTLGRLETGQHRPQLEPTALAPVVEDVAEEGRVLAETKGLTLRLGRIDAAEVYGDAVLLHQLGYNLVENAVKYTPTGGRVEISLVVIGNMVHVTVSDTGVGIEAEELPHIFDRFYRGDKVRNHTRDGGSGLGLALVKQIVEVHRGSIDVTSKSGEGSAFTVTLPVSTRLTGDSIEADGAPANERTPT